MQAITMAGDKNTHKSKKRIKPVGPCWPAHAKRLTKPAMKNAMNLRAKDNNNKMTMKAATSRKNKFVESFILHPKLLEPLLTSNPNRDIETGMKVLPDREGYPSKIRRLPKPLA